MSRRYKNVFKFTELLHSQGICYTTLYIKTAC